MRFENGERVWVGPSESEEVYDIRCVVKERVNDPGCSIYNTKPLRLSREVDGMSTKEATVTVSNGSSDEVVPLARCFGANPTHVNDLCGLHNIHEAGKF